ncbi:MAG: hypothetical protein IE880_07735 [Epsilonproteobacteria bacterium]|nr:hypothetical protein [Campylobacterota bacterium]
MYAVEFQATIENGIVRIPEEYRDLQEKGEVRFVIMYDDSDNKYRTNIQKKRKKMSAISIDTIGFKFNRDEAH